MLRAGGFTYLGVLFAIALIGVVLAGAASLWQIGAWREREAELLFIGRQFARALAAYHEATPGPRKEWPRTLAELVEDRRHEAAPRRHLRRLYRDPVTGAADWALVREGAGIVGVHSRSTQAPLKRANFPPGQEQFDGAGRYADWVFTARSAEGAGTAAAPGGAAAADAAPPGTPASSLAPGTPAPADTPLQPAVPDAPVDACHAERVAGLRNCLLNTAAPAAERHRCVVEVNFRYQACRRE
jgi:type II secretory pathway pseudopilin PulG